MLASEKDNDFFSDALCKGLHPDIFFPPALGPAQRKAIARAKVICNQCPVKNQCLKYALDHGILYGIWGGLTEDERRDLKRERH